MTDLVWRSLLLLGLAWLTAEVLLRRSSAARRHVIWLLALGTLLALPLLEPIRQWTPAPRALTPLPALPGITRTVINVTAAAPGVPWGNVAWMVWLAGAALLLARFARGQMMASSIALRARPSAWPDVKYSDRISVPMVCGLWEPVVVLPAEAEHWPAQRRDAALAHEREHVRRKDTSSQALAQAACAFYWPQPLVWLAAAALRRECEQAADDGVLVNQGTPASAYAGHLVDIARALADPRRVAPAGGIAMTRTTQLHRRVAALLDPRTDRRAAGAAFSRALLTLSLAAALGVAALPELAWGQMPGTLAGVVRDPSGAVIPKARIDLSAKGLREVVYSNAAGEFAFERLADGIYDIAVSVPGFARMQQTGVRFENGQTRKLDMVLQMGSLTERMTVEAGDNVPPPNAPLRSADGPKRIRVGGNVQSAKLVSQVRPEYPPAAKAERVEGTVILNAVIGVDGSIVNVEPMNKQVDQRLVDSALRAVRQWRYSTTLLNGVPVEVNTSIEVNYTLSR